MLEQFARTVKEDTVSRFRLPSGSIAFIGALWLSSIFYGVSGSGLPKVRAQSRQQYGQVLLAIEGQTRVYWHSAGSTDPDLMVQENTLKSTHLKSESGSAIRYCYLRSDIRIHCVDTDSGSLEWPPISGCIVSTQIRDPLSGHRYQDALCRLRFGIP